MKTQSINKSLGKGRPKAQQNENKRECILDNAFYLFAKQGVGGTTVAQIAERSGVTSAMVHYYFKNWEGLLDVLMEERIAPKIAFVWKDLDCSVSVSELIETLLNRFFVVIEESPAFPELFSREIFHVGGSFRARFIKHFPKKHFTAVRKLFEKAQRQGEIAPSIQTDLIIVSVIGLIMFPLIMYDIVSPITNLPVVDKKIFKQHVLSMVLQGIYSVKGKEQ